jgi:ketosteroid isomerase-like protein
MSDFQAIADRVEIEALRGEFTDAAMMRDRARLASLFTPDGVLRMPNIPAELAGREQIRAGGERLQAEWDFFVQTTHPGTIQLDGDTATGRAYIQELARTRDGRSAPAAAGSSPRGSTRSGTSTPARWRARRPAQPEHPPHRSPTRRPRRAWSGRPLR